MKNNILKIPFCGNSMSPNLVDGDLLYVKESSNYEFGDIIVFNDESNTLIAHRIVSKKTLKTKGDRSKLFDSNPHHKQIIGKVIYVYRDKFLYDFSKNKLFPPLFAFLSSLNTNRNPLRKIVFLTLWPLNFLFVRCISKENPKRSSLQ